MIEGGTPTVWQPASFGRHTRGWVGLGRRYIATEASSCGRCRRGKGHPSTFLWGVGTSMLHCGTPKPPKHVCEGFERCACGLGAPLRLETLGERQGGRHVSRAIQCSAAGPAGCRCSSKTQHTNWKREDIRDRGCEDLRGGTVNSPSPCHLRRPMQAFGVEHFERHNQRDLLDACILGGLQVVIPSPTGNPIGWLPTKSITSQIG